MSKNIEHLYLLKGIATQHIKQSRYSEALVYLKDILSKFKQEVHQIHSQQEMEKAIRQLQIASRKNLSLCYLKLQHYQNCIKQCREVLEVEPNNVKIIYRIGRAYIQLKNYESAEHYLKKGFYLEPQQIQIMKALQEIQRCKRPPVKESIQNKWSLSRLITCIIMLILSMIRYLFKGKEKVERHQ